MIELRPLDGGNPLGFLAALGTLVVADRMLGPTRARLSWVDEVRPYPLLDVESVDQLVEAVMADRDAWVGVPGLDFPPPPAPPWDEVKVAPADVRRWLQACHEYEAHDGGRSLGLASALVAEGSLAENKEEAKPSDLHFTTGQQKFLAMARRLRDGLTGGHVREAVVGPWRYKSHLKSFKWDVTDDRVYALAATNPATDAKLTVPGAEWLALMGLSLLGVTARRGAGSDRTLTPGTSGSWKSGSFTWALWAAPLGVDTVRSVLTVPELTGIDGPAPALDVQARGLLRVYRSVITRSNQGGYGSFRPPSIVADVDAGAAVRPGG